MPYVNAKSMLADAKRGHYAVGQFNLNNMESVRAFLLAAQACESPIILGVTGQAADYMGGYRTIADTVRGFVEHLKISVPVCLHADHGTFEQALAAIDGGFSSVMFDGSKYPFEENVERTREIIRRAHDKDMTVEAEVGAVEGGEDGQEAKGECADPAQCARIADLGVDCLAAGIGNIHGHYPPDWPGLRFDVLDAIQRRTGDLPLVLHGGSGISEEMIRQAIRLGVTKVNVNTECQAAFAEATRAYIEAGRDRQGRGFTVQSLLAPGLEATKAVCIEKMTLFGSVGKATT